MQWLNQSNLMILVPWMISARIIGCMVFGIYLYLTAFFKYRDMKSLCGTQRSYMKNVNEFDAVFLQEDNICM